MFRMEIESLEYLFCTTALDIVPCSLRYAVAECRPRENNRVGRRRSKDYHSRLAELASPLVVMKRLLLVHTKQRLSHRRGRKNRTYACDR